MLPVKVTFVYGISASFAGRRIWGTWFEIFGDSLIEIRGITWDHPRGRDPLLATACAFERENPSVKVTWVARSLHDFGHHPVDELAKYYDLVVLDHPWVGFVADAGCYVPFEEVLDPAILSDLADHSAGPSHESYKWNGNQWALAIDAATPCSSYRPDLLDQLESEVPRNWSEVVALGRNCKAHGTFIAIPLCPVDAVTTFLSLVANLGVAPFGDGMHVVNGEVGRHVINQIIQILPYCCDDVFSLTPIRVMERMSTTDSLAYCPLAYGYNNYSRVGFRRHVCLYANMPSVGDRGPIGSHLGGAGIAISRGSRHAETAVAYALKVASAEWQRSIYFEAGGQPAHTAAWEDSRVNSACNNFFLNTRATIEQAYVRPRFNGYIAFQYEGGELLTRFLAAGGGDVSALMYDLNRLYALADSGRRD